MKIDWRNVKPHDSDSNVFTFEELLYYNEHCIEFHFSWRDIRGRIEILRSYYEEMKKSGVLDSYLMDRALEMIRDSGKFTVAVYEGDSRKR